MRTIGTLMVTLGLGCWAIATMFFIFALQAGSRPNPFGLLWMFLGVVGFFPLVVGALVRIAFRKPVQVNVRPVA